MRFVDCHLHTNLIDDGVTQGLAMSGMEAAVIPMLHSLSGLYNADGALRLWDRFLGFEIKRGTTIGYEAFVSLSVPMYGLSSEGIDECLKKLPEYLKHERVVAMGEMGLDVGGENEEILFRAQLQIAKAHNLPVILHTPIRLAPQAPEIIRKVVKIIQEEKFDITRSVLDHAGESTFDYRMSTGAMVGLSVCMDKMPPEVAANYVLNNPDKRNKLLINTEVAAGDGYFTIPMVTLAMRRLGMKYHDIEQVVYHNPKKFFKLPIDGVIFRIRRYSYLSICC
jgi:predicted metal-dependent TIM-barrel fold hydrolase